MTDAPHVLPHEIHLVVPMSGQGSRYRRAGYADPKPMIPVNGAPMLQRLLDCFPAHWPTHFVMAENHRDTGLPALAARLRPRGVQRFVPAHAEGPGRALEAALEGVPDTAPVFVSYCDYGMVWDAGAFARFVRDCACDAALVTYRGFHAHYLSATPYAYARLARGRVVEVREKGHFSADRESEHASTGGYYFRSAALLRRALAAQRAAALTVGGELYTSLTVEALLRARPQPDVRVFEVPAFFQWGTPQDLEDFSYWERSCAAHGRALPAPPRVEQVVLPMAGMGSRFRHLTAVPKPLLRVDGQPMFCAALDSLPRARRSVVVALAAIGGEVDAALAGRAGTEVVRLRETPAGQALSTRAALPALDAHGDVLVSACDHAIALDPAAWAAFRADPRCDAAILTITGYPGTHRRPQAYSYVVPEPDAGDACPRVRAVGVKEPRTARPQDEPLVVGTFWFRSAAVLAGAIDALIAADARVNGELYLDAALGMLIAAGRTVRHVPLAGFVCWGDPDCMAEALYWSETFSGRRLTRRARLPGALDAA